MGKTEMRLELYRLHSSHRSPKRRLQFTEADGGEGLASPELLQLPRPNTKRRSSSARSVLSTPRDGVQSDGVRCRRDPRLEFEGLRQARHPVQALSHGCGHPAGQRTSKPLRPRIRHCDHLPIPPLGAGPAKLLQILC